MEKNNDKILLPLFLAFIIGVAVGIIATGLIYKKEINSINLENDRRIKELDKKVDFFYSDIVEDSMVLQSIIDDPDIDVEELRRDLQIRKARRKIIQEKSSEIDAIIKDLLEEKEEPNKEVEEVK